MATETDDQTLAGAIDDLARRGFTVLPRRLLAKRLYAAERREPEGAATTSDGLLPRLEQLLQLSEGFGSAPLTLPLGGRAMLAPWRATDRSSGRARRAAASAARRSG